LQVERRYAAAFGLEIRAPLRDPDLVELMLAVPDHLLAQGTETRPVLREACSGLLPESVRLRRGKAAFSAVLERGLAPENLRWAPALLERPDALWHGFVEEAAVRRWLAGDLATNADRIGLLHCLYGELWRHVRSGGDLREVARISL
jgi:asparagine synthase (glutamine-hydrolysing)